MAPTPEVGRRVPHRIGTRGRLAGSPDRPAPRRPWLALLAPLAVLLGGCSVAGPDRAAPALDAPSPGARLQAARVLAALDPDADALRSAAGADDWVVRTQAVDTIGRQSPPSAAALARFLDDPDWHVRSAAVAALRRAGGEDAVEPLTTALRDPDERVRMEACRALGDLGPLAAPATPVLVELLDDSSGRVRRRARWALDAIRGQP